MSDNCTNLRCEWWHRIPFSMETIYSDDRFEVAENEREVVILFPCIGREYLWDFSRTLIGLQAYKGIASSACQLLERYLAIYTLRNSHLIPNSLEWQQCKLELMNKILMVVGICVRLASKASSSPHVIVSSQSLMLYLRQNAFFYTIHDINSCELEVFRSLSYRIPLWTNVEKAGMMAHEVGLRGELLSDAIVFIMELADYRRPELHDKIKSKAIEINSHRDNDGDGSSPFGNFQHAIYVRNMHVIAGVLAAINRFFRAFGPDPTEQLANLTFSPARYIKCIADILIEMIIDFQNRYNNGTNLIQNIEVQHRADPSNTQARLL